jgi:hypothetical protein
VRTAILPICSGHIGRRSSRWPVADSGAVPETRGETGYASRRPSAIAAGCCHADRLLARLLADHRGIRKKAATLPPKRIAVSCAGSTAEHACSAAARASSDPAEECCRQAELLRDIIGNLLLPLPATDLGPIIPSIRSPVWLRRLLCLATSAGRSGKWCRHNNPATPEVHFRVAMTALPCKGTTEDPGQRMTWGLEACQRGTRHKTSESTGRRRISQVPCTWALVFSYSRSWSVGLPLLRSCPARCVPLTVPSKASDFLQRQSSGQDGPAKIVALFHKTRQLPGYRPVGQPLQRAAV